MRRDRGDVSEMSYEDSEAQDLARGSVLAIGAIKEMAVLARDLQKVLTPSQVRSLVRCLTGQRDQEGERDEPA